MRVPGIGPTAARRLVAARSGGRLLDERALRAAGASWRRALPYVTFAGKMRGQLRLFA